MLSRIQLLLKVKNLTASRFADEIGVQRSSISHILSGRNQPSLDLITKILNTFPDISPDWLILGKGPMNSANIGQIDLFERESAEVIHAEKDIEPTIEESPIDQSDQIQSTSAQNDAPGKPETSKLREKPALETIKNESVEKIVIFHSDGTYRMYYPDNG